jgi:hypothetical protein
MLPHPATQVIARSENHYSFDGRENGEGAELNGLAIWCT